MRTIRDIAISDPEPVLQGLLRFLEPLLSGQGRQRHHSGSPMGAPLPSRRSERLYEQLVDSGAIAPLQRRHVHVLPPLEVAGRGRSLRRARYILIANVRDRVTSVASRSSAPFW
jgi:hypothetical protein